MATRTARLNLTARDRASGPIALVGRNLRALGGIATAVGAIALGRIMVRGAQDALRSIIATGSGFQKAMSNIQSVTQGTGGDMEALAKTARTLGKDTVFSATEAATAMENFALAGFEVNEIIGVLPATLALAAAGELGMGDAARIASGIIRAFDKDVTELQGVVDTLAAAASSSNQTVLQLGESFKFAGTTASSLGISVEETAALMSILADRNLRADLSGTALRRTFAAFLGDLDAGAAGLGGFNAEMARNTDGSFNFAKAVDLMTAAGIKSTDAYKLFGLRAGAAMDILLRQGGDTIRKYTEITSQSGVAAQQSADRINNLQGSVKLLNSALADVSIELFGALEPLLRATVDSFTVLVAAFGELLEEAKPLNLVLAQTGLVVVDVAEGLLVLSDRLLRVKEALGVNAVQVWQAAIAPGAITTKVWADRILTAVLALDEHTLAQQKGLETMDKYRARLDLIRERLDAVIAAQTAAATAPPIKPELEPGPLLTTFQLFTESLEALGISTLAELQGKAEQVAQAFGLVNEVQGQISPERYSAIIEQLREMAAKITEEGGVVPGLREIEVQGTQAFISMEEAARRLVTQGVQALNVELQQTNTAVESLGTTIKTRIGQQGVQAARQLGNQLLIAATTGNTSFQDFFRLVATGFAAAIIDALILKAITATIGGFGGGASGGGVAGGGGAALQGGGGFTAAHGRVLTGVDTGHDRIPLLARPGEAILPPQLTDLLLDAAGGGRGGGGGAMTIHLSADIPMTIKRITEGVRDGRGVLEATRVFSGTNTVV